MITSLIAPKPSCIALTSRVDCFAIFSPATFNLEVVKIIIGYRSQQNLTLTLEHNWID